MEDLVLIGVVFLMVISAWLYARTSRKLAWAQLRLRQELDTSKTLRVEIGVLTTLHCIRPWGEGAIDVLEEEDLRHMSRENLQAHYLCAMANWNSALDHRDELLAELGR